MKRRELMLLLGGAMTAASAVRAHQKAMPVIGSSAAPRPGRMHRLWPRSTRD